MGFSGFKVVLSELMGMMSMSIHSNACWCRCSQNKVDKAARPANTSVEPVS